MPESKHTGNSFKCNKCEGLINERHELQRGDEGSEGEDGQDPEAVYCEDCKGSCRCCSADLQIAVEREAQERTALSLPLLALVVI